MAAFFFHLCDSRRMIGFLDLPGRFDVFERAQEEVRVVTIIDLLPITIIDVSRGLQRAVVPVASPVLSRIVVPFPLVSGWRNRNGPMISLRPSLITAHHSVSSLNDLAREASPSSRDLLPAHDEDTTYPVGGNCSRVDGDKRIERIEPRSYSPGASVDPTDARSGIASGATPADSVDQTDAPLGRSWFAHHDVMLRRDAPLDL
jgi:hypothetical protein